LCIGCHKEKSKKEREIYNELRRRDKEEN